MLDLDVASLSLNKALDRLTAANLKYNVVIARPSGSRLPLLDETELYVIRQTVDSNGVQQLVAAAKMAKHGQDMPVSPN